MTDTEAWILSLLRPMIGDKLKYGSLVVKVQAGEVVHIQENNEHKPPKRKGRRIVV